MVGVRGAVWGNGDRNGVRIAAVRKGTNVNLSMAEAAEPRPPAWL